MPALNEGIQIMFIALSSYTIAAVVGAILLIIILAILARYTTRVGGSLAALFGWFKWW